MSFMPVPVPGMDLIPLPVGGRHPPPQQNGPLLQISASQQPQWQEASQVKECSSCKEAFGLFKNSTKRHCRRCGFVNCDACTKIQIPLPPLHPDPVPICKNCWSIIASAVSGSAASSSSSNQAAIAENIQILTSLFPSYDREIITEILYGQQNQLAKAIQFLKASGSDQEEAKLAGSVSKMTIAKLPDGSPAANSASSIPTLHLLAPDRSLTDLQKRFFYTHGFLHLTQIIPPHMVQTVLGHINESLGQGINNANWHKNPNNLSAKSPSYCPDVTSHPAVVSIFKDTPIPRIVESLLGVGGFHIPTQCQVALTFPNATKTGATGPGGLAGAINYWSNPENYKKAWHIDGIHRKSQGFEVDEIKNFTLLVGVYLSAAPQDFSGNIAVFPGSHKELEKYFRVVDPLVRIVDDQLPPIPLNSPHQLHVQPGDILLSHYQTAHTVTPNYSSSIRYALYFRLIHSSRSWGYKKECMTNIWLEYEGLKDIHAEVQAQELERERQAQLEKERAARKAQEEADRIQALELQRQFNEQEQQQRQQQAAQQQQQQIQRGIPVQPSSAYSQIPLAQPIPGPYPYATPLQPPPPQQFGQEYGQLQQQSIGGGGGGMNGQYNPYLAQPQQSLPLAQQQQPRQPSQSSNTYPGLALQQQSQGGNAGGYPGSMGQQSQQPQSIQMMNMQQQQQFQRQQQLAYGQQQQQPQQPYSQPKYIQ